MTALTAIATTCFVYVGSYTKGPEEGITLLKLDEKSGRIENMGVVAAAPNPSFLAIDGAGEYLYAIHERNPGSVAAYRINKTNGKLTFLNTAETGGPGPCHVFVDEGRKNLLAANYSDGSVACIRIGADGSLGAKSSYHKHKGTGPVTARQEAAHAHGVYLSPDEKFALVPDLGTDEIKIYRFDSAKGILTPNTPAAGRTAPGAGPRHGTFSPDGTQFYCINELDNTITRFAWDATKGFLTALDAVTTLEKPVANSTTAEIEFHPNGKFLYGSNRGEDTIVSYEVKASGELKRIQSISTTGPSPRHFAVHPSGKWMLAGNQSAETLVTYAIDPATGILTQHGQPLPLRSPVCMVYLRIP